MNNKIEPEIYVLCKTVKFINRMQKKLNRKYKKNYTYFDVINLIKKVLS